MTAPLALVAISTALVAAIVALVVLNIFAIVFGLSFLRAQRAARVTPGGQLEVPGKPVKSMARRDFFRYSLLTSLLVFGAQFGGATLAFLWPNLRGGFGSQIVAGNIDDIKAAIQETGAPVYVGTGRFYVVPYDGTPTPDADYYAVGAVPTGSWRCISGASTWAAACRSASLEVVRMPVPRFQVQRGRRVPVGSGAHRHGAVPDLGRRQRRRHRRYRRAHPGTATRHRHDQ